MELEEDFVSIGQKLGFVSAGDELRAAKKENRRLNATIADKDAKIAAMEAENASQAAYIKKLEAQVAAKQN